MKVKELKEILNSANDNEDVWIEDADGSCVEVVDGRYSGDHCCVYLTTRQEFPESWYKDGEEIHWIKGKAVTLDNYEETDIIYYNDESTGFGEIELNLTFHDGYATDDRGATIKYPKLSELTDEQIELLNDYLGGVIVESGVVTPHDVCLKYGFCLQYSGIMDAGQNHDEDLVEQINIKWFKFRDRFKPILCALYERDAEEILNSDAFSFDPAADADYVKTYMQKEWEVEANNYLMHIADDQDLSTILKFVRFDVCEDGTHC